MYFTQSNVIGNGCLPYLWGQHYREERVGQVSGCGHRRGERPKVVSYSQTGLWLLHLVVGIGPMNSTQNNDKQNLRREVPVTDTLLIQNQFELVRWITETNFWLYQLDFFDENGLFTQGTCAYILAGTGPLKTANVTRIFLFFVKTVLNVSGLRGNYQAIASREQAKIGIKVAH